jgi:arylsulfatase A
MDRRTPVHLATATFAAVVCGGCRSLPLPHGLDGLPDERPNVVIIFTDDQGYGDVGCFGATGFETPNLDRLAAEGVRFTDFYAPATVCTPSRAGLLTGCYPKRVGLHEAVIFPEDTHGLNAREITIAELLQDAGYATGCFGKWHLGHQPEFLPTRQGFDVYFGLPYSNDMSTRWIRREGYPHLPLIRGETTIELEPNQHTLTRRYTEEACRFIQEHADGPFFVYVPHSMPHYPVAASDAFAGRTDRIYDDVIEEIDWSVGRIYDTLHEVGVADNTLVVFSSDNGPATWYGDQGGSSGGLRGTKGTTWEGGQRVPTIMWWPEVIPPGSNTTALTTNMDLLPTIARIARVRVPADRHIDGHDITAILKRPNSASSPYRALIYYARNGEPEAIRLGDWKLHIAKSRGWKTTQWGPFSPQLYDLATDPGEQDDVAAEHPDVVKLLTRILGEMDESIERHARPVGRADG